MENTQHERNLEANAAFKKELAKEIWKDIVSQCNKREYEDESGYESVTISGNLPYGITYEANVVVNFTYSIEDGASHMGWTEKLTYIDIDDIIFENAYVYSDEDSVDIDEELTNESYKL